MTMKLNRSAYEQLVREDIEWLEKQPRTLEREHILAIVKDSSLLYYDAEELALEVCVVDNTLKPNPNWSRVRALASKILKWTDVEPPEVVRLTVRCTCGATDALSDLHDPQCVLAQANQVPFKIHFDP